MIERLRLSEDEKWAAFLALVEKVNRDKEPDEIDIQIASKLAVNLDQLGYKGPILTKWMKEWKPTYRMQASRMLKRG